jgi:hypothetical protein
VQAIEEDERIERSVAEHMRAYDAAHGWSAPRK